MKLIWLVILAISLFLLTSCNSAGKAYETDVETAPSDQLPSSDSGSQGNPYEEEGYSYSEIANPGQYFEISEPSEPSEPPLFQDDTQKKKYICVCEPLSVAVTFSCKVNYPDGTHETKYYVPCKGSPGKICLQNTPPPKGGGSSLSSTSSASSSTRCETNPDCTADKAATVKECAANAVKDGSITLPVLSAADQKKCTDMGGTMNPPDVELKSTNVYCPIPASN